VSSAELRIINREDLYPVCPHCGEELREVYTRKRGMPLFVGRDTICFCPHCRKVLGFGQSRMA